MNTFNYTFDKGHVPIYLRKKGGKFTPGREETVRVTILSRGQPVTAFSSKKKNSLEILEEPVKAEHLFFSFKEIRRFLTRPQLHECLLPNLHRPPFFAQFSSYCITLSARL